MERWLVVLERRNVIGTPDRDDQVCVGGVGVKAIGDQSGILQGQLIALKQFARTGHFSSFADSGSGDRDRHALLGIQEGHNRTQIFANAFAVESQRAGQLPAMLAKPTVERFLESI